MPLAKAVLHPVSEGFRHSSDDMLSRCVNEDCNRVSADQGGICAVSFSHHTSQLRLVLLTVFSATLHCLHFRCSSVLLRVHSGFRGKLFIGRRYIRNIRSRRIREATGRCGANLPASHGSLNLDGRLLHRLLLLARTSAALRGLQRRCRGGLLLLLCLLFGFHVSPQHTTALHALHAGGRLGLLLPHHLGSVPPRRSLNERGSGLRLRLVVDPADIIKRHTLLGHRQEGLDQFCSLWTVLRVVPHEPGSEERDG
mmetsp:Transcript_6777/g.17578  ORF Transcript_6777/g.17578 Transcript_6777/m.17578 type:complete len:254 (-) Transcript_6777:188-949(-)